MSALELGKIMSKKSDRRKRLRSSMEKMLPQLEELGALKIIIFGSLVDGTTHSRSDLDILVVMPAERSGREWSRYIYEMIDRDVAADILVFNTIELKKEIHANVFLRRVMEKGRLVFEKDS